MGNSFKDFLRTQKDEKICDRQIFLSVVRTVIIMVACLAAMSLSAYAYFSHNVASDSNRILAASFEAGITVGPEDAAAEVKTIEQNKQTITFLQAGKYTVRLEKGSSSASTGFCIVHIDGKKYHTQQIGVDTAADGGVRQSLEFVLDVTGIATVMIESHWGTSSYYQYDNSESNDMYIRDRKEIQVVGAVTSAMDTGEETQTGAETENTPTASQPTEPVVTEPAETQSTTVPTEPVVTEPAETQSTTTPTEPAATQPTATEPPKEDSTDTTQGQTGGPEDPAPTQTESTEPSDDSSA